MIKLTSPYLNDADIVNDVYGPECRDFWKWVNEVLPNYEFHTTRIMENTRDIYLWSEKETIDWLFGIASDEVMDSDTPLGIRCAPPGFDSPQAYSAWQMARSWLAYSKFDDKPNTSHFGKPGYFPSFKRIMNHFGFQDKYYNDIVDVKYLCQNGANYFDLTLKTDKQDITYQYLLFISFN